LRLEDWRRKVAITGQNMHLFRTTVRENIQYGRLNASFDEIVNASRDAEAWEFMSNLPSGFSTEVGDQGAQLSEGRSNESHWHEPSAARSGYFAFGRSH
jgi:ABC-type multidrug transport system fused ATPase/permease subunit